MNRKKVSKYAKLVKAQAAKCNGKGKASTVTAAKKAYIADAVKKGKSKAEATAIANRVTRKCKK